jgi:cell division protein FtsN
MASRRRSRKRASETTPGWVWMLFGLGLGLLVALGAYVSEGRLPRRPEPKTPPAPQAQPRASQPDADTETRFDFYDMLPNFEVVIPEVESQARPDDKRGAVAEPGKYVLQAGSFTTHADADRMKATLALLGIESRIQKVTVDDDVYHRVRIGPISDLDKLNAVRRRLHQAEIEVLLMKVP